MHKHVSCCLRVAVCVGWLGCSNNTPAAGSAAGSGGRSGVSTPPSTAAGSSAAGSINSGTAGKASTAVGQTGGVAGALAAGSGAGRSGGAGAAGMAQTAGSAGEAAGSPAAGGGASGSTAATGGAGGSASAGSNDLSGMLGALGAVKPVMAGWATTNGLETLIYLSSSPMTCAMMMTKGVKWLASLPAGTQVIEIVVRGNAMVGTTPVGPLQGEVNYAEGSKSSSTEVVASSGSIMFTKAESKQVFEGMLMATYPKGNLMGKFHADWCEGGTEY